MADRRVRPVLAADLGSGSRRGGGVRGGDCHRDAPAAGRRDDQVGGAMVGVALPPGDKHQPPVPCRASRAYSASEASYRFPPQQQHDVDSPHLG